MSFADELDQATQRAEDERQSKVEEVRRKAQPEQEQNLDGSWPEPECRSCGDPIEPGRLNLGFVRCIDCATKLERRVRGYF